MPKWLLNCLYKLLLGVELERLRRLGEPLGEKCNVEKWNGRTFYHFLPHCSLQSHNPTIEMKTYVYRNKKSPLYIS